MVGGCLDSSTRAGTPHSWCRLVNAFRRFIHGVARNYDPSAQPRSSPVQVFVGVLGSVQRSSWDQVGSGLVEGLERGPKCGHCRSDWIQRGAGDVVRMILAEKRREHGGFHCQSITERQRTGGHKLPGDSQPLNRDTSISPRGNTIERSSDE